MTIPLTIWIIDDDQSIRWVLDKALTQESYNTILFESASDALLQLKKGQTPDCILSDVRMPGIDGFEFLKQVKKIVPSLPIIIMTAYSDLDTTVKAYQDGAFEYLPKPFDINEVIELTRKATRQQVKNNFNAADSLPLSDQIIGESPALQEVFRIIGRLSKSNISVLINGESGTGKELVANALHTHSPRSDSSFVAINTAAIPKDLLESELFGHEKGAFTGAQSSRKGRFEQADGGTLFLDEIGDMPMSLQTRLLRVLAEGEFYRVGGNSTICVDVRVIAATHHDLKKLVDDGTFREDLYHRLNVIRLHLPALRERKEDIPLLLNHFLQLTAKELGETQKTMNSEVSNYLSSLTWSGNVRQLENTCRWFTVMATGNEINMEDLPADLKPLNQISNIQNHESPQTIQYQWEDLLRLWINEKLDEGESNIIEEAGAIFERTLLEAALEKTNGRKQEAALLIGWGRNTITRKIKELIKN
ncbi:MAG: nitrogen regulation protein NR(I) [Gammaproteobacteria bacterium]|nr:nitrogen regulation protein NR(I) [Gammaproteobacteria bacterium]